MLGNADARVYAVSRYWNLDDEIGCRFDCDELGLDWPDQAPLLSERDRQPITYTQMCDAWLERHEALRNGASA
jgi:dTDP-4-dehydrorhamnose 3,5-epimerase